MSNRAVIIFFNFIFLLCSQTTYAEGQCSSAQIAKVPPIGEKAYKDARKILIREGWQPASFNYEHIQDPMYEFLTKEIVDYGWSEVKKCASTGAASCLMYFSDVYGNILEIKTEGEFSPDRNRLKKFPLVRSAKLICK